METDGNTNAERSSRCLFGDAKGAVEHVVKVGGVAAGFSRKKLKSPCHSDHHREKFYEALSPVPTEFVPIPRWTEQLLSIQLVKQGCIIFPSFIHLSWPPASTQQRYEPIVDSDSEPT